MTRQEAYLDGHNIGLVWFRETEPSPPNYHNKQNSVELKQEWTRGFRVGWQKKKDRDSKPRNPL